MCVAVILRRTALHVHKQTHRTTFVFFFRCRYTNKIHKTINCFGDAFAVERTRGTSDVREHMQRSSVNFMMAKSKQHQIGCSQQYFQ